MEVSFFPFSIQFHERNVLHDNLKTLKGVKLTNLSRIFLIFLYSSSQCMQIPQLLFREADDILITHCVINTYLGSMSSLIVRYGTKDCQKPEKIAKHKGKVHKGK